MSVDGSTVTTQGMRVDPQRAVVRVDGERIPTARGIAYLALNKPKSVVTSMDDEHGRKCVGDLVRDRRERLFHVGRLDYETEGLLLLTGDGDLAHRLMHPSFGVEKVYLAEVKGPLGRDVAKRLRTGVKLDDGPAKVDRFRVVGEAKQRVQVEITLHEGRNRIVRRLMEEVGHPVERLVRKQFGPVRLGQLKPGAVRELSQKEIGQLLDLVDLAATAAVVDRPLRLALAKVSRVPMRAMRGATQLQADDRDEMTDAVVELLREMLVRNNLTTDDLVSVIFTEYPRPRIRVPGRCRPHAGHRRRAAAVRPRAGGWHGAAAGGARHGAF